MVNRRHEETSPMYVIYVLYYYSSVMPDICKQSINVLYYVGLFPIKFEFAFLNNIINTDMYNSLRCV